MTCQVTFWQNMPSHHMAPVQRGLARFEGYNVRIVFAHNISEDRRGMGWSMPDLHPAHVQFLDGNVSKARELAQESHGLNFFGGLPAGVLKEAFDHLPVESGDVHSSLILEAGDTHDVKGKLRPLFHSMRIRQLRSRVDFVLAFGTLGVEYYVRRGFDRKRVFPFLYQSDNPVVGAAVPTSDPVRIVYCGRFSRTKGVDVLLRALASLSNMAWELELVGGGPEAARLRDLAETLNLSHRVTWRSFVPSDEVAHILRHKDICVVPSRYDGWGMLTNEALSAGVPVVTTSRVGSKDLIEASGAGRVAKSTTQRSLKKCLEELIGSPKQIDLAKRAAERFIPCIDNQRISKNLAELIEFQIGGRTSYTLPCWSPSGQAKPPVKT